MRRIRDVFLALHFRDMDGYLGADGWERSAFREGLSKECVKYNTIEMAFELQFDKSRFPKYT